MSPCFPSRNSGGTTEADRGHPRLSLHRFGSGSSGSTNSHYASFNNSNRFLLMHPVHQSNFLMQRTWLDAVSIYETHSNAWAAQFCRSFVRQESHFSTYRALFDLICTQVSLRVAYKSECAGHAPTGSIQREHPHTLTPSNRLRLRMEMILYP